MAGRGGGKEIVDGSGYLSDESEFYGDEVVKHDLEERASSFDVAEWCKHKIPTLMELAETNIKTEPAVESVKLYNPYEGRMDARQLSESVNDFLARLQPSTTSASSLIPWIYIANPYRKVPQQKDHDGYSRTGEAPPDEDSEWGEFAVIGNRLLQQLTKIRHDVEKKNPSKDKGAVTRMINKDKDRIVKEILDTAKSLHCITGKWMLFCDSGEIDAVWSVVARATAENDLGVAAKVAPEDGQNKPRIVCVYTKDFTDMKDVSRVVRKMKDLGLVDNHKPIYYKCDAYTFLDLSSSNPYNLKASLYNSKDILQAKTEKQLDSFFYKRRDAGDWRPLEWE